MIWPTTLGGITKANADVLARFLRFCYLNLLSPNLGSPIRVLAGFILILD